MSLFVKHDVEPFERMQLLSGKPPASYKDTGPTICSCFNVGKEVILKAIREDGQASVPEIGEKLLAGTNCGSCIPELKELLKTEQTEESSNTSCGMPCK